LSGTAGSPPSISFSTSCRELESDAHNPFAHGN
jgi:hypothetical protein